MKLAEGSMCIILYYFECARMFCYEDFGVAPRVHLLIFSSHLCIYQLW